MSIQTHPAIAAEDQHTDLDEDPFPPMLVRSLEAFRRDLPQLLQTDCGKWVAYHGDRQVGLGRTQTELYQKGFARGLKPDEFLVCSIEPEIPDEEITWSYGF